MVITDAIAHAILSPPAGGGAEGNLGGHPGLSGGSGGSCGSGQGLRG